MSVTNNPLKRQYDSNFELPSNEKKQKIIDLKIQKVEEHLKTSLNKMSTPGQNQPPIAEVSELTKKSLKILQKIKNLFSSNQISEETTQKSIETKELFWNLKNHINKRNKEEIAKILHLIFDDNERLISILHFIEIEDITFIAFFLKKAFEKNRPEIFLQVVDYIYEKNPEVLKDSILLNIFEKVFNLAPWSDCVIHFICKNRQISCHCIRGLLKNSSHYFNSLLSDKFKEGAQKEIQINLTEFGISPEILMDIIKFIYSGQILLTENRIPTILRLSVFLGIDLLKERCEQWVFDFGHPFLMSNILYSFLKEFHLYGWNKQNVIDFYNLGTELSCKSFQQETLTCASEVFLSKEACPEIKEFVLAHSKEVKSVTLQFYNHTPQQVTQSLNELLNYFPNLKRLSLNLSEAYDLKQITKFQHLESLELNFYSSTKLSKSAISIFSNKNQRFLNQLKELHININLNSSELISYLKNLKKLEVLRINLYQKFKKELITDFASFSCLKHLEIKCKDVFEAYNDKTPFLLPPLPQLEFLSLPRIDNKDFSIFPMLKTLHLQNSSNAVLETLNLNALLENSFKMRLKKLHISGSTTNLSAASMQYLPAMKVLENLEIEGIKDFNSDYSAKKIAEIPRLKHLHLHVPSLDSKWLEMFCQELDDNERLDQIESLYLYFEETYVSARFNFSQFINLRKLVLVFENPSLVNKVRSLDIEDLKQLSRLEEIYLKHISLSQESLHNIHSYFPYLRYFDDTEAWASNNSSFINNSWKITTDGSYQLDGLKINQLRINKTPKNLSKEKWKENFNKIDFNYVEEIRFSDTTGLTNEEIIFILSKAVNLKHLYIENYTNSDSVLLFEAISKLENLKSLNFHDCTFHLKQASSIKSLKNLQKLRIGTFRINYDLRDLGFVDNMASLKTAEFNGLELKPTQETIHT